MDKSKGISFEQARNETRTLDEFEPRVQLLRRSEPLFLATAIWNGKSVEALRVDHDEWYRQMSKEDKLNT